MDNEVFFEMAIVPEAQTLELEKWLKDKFITYSMTKVVTKVVQYGSRYRPERAVGYLMLLTKHDYDEMISEFGKETNEI